MKDSTGLRDKLGRLVDLLDEIGAEMDASIVPCASCGFGKQTSHDDWEMRRICEQTSDRVAKMLRKLERDEWPGRTLTPGITADADELRGQP